MTDHIFVMKTIIKSYKLKRKPIYSLVGDFNSRTDNIQEISTDISDMTDENRHEIRNDVCMPQRHNEDVTVNKYGINLMNIIEQSQLIILNGRVLGDLKGSKTCQKYNGSSTVDYMIFQKTFRAT